MEGRVHQRINKFLASPLQGRFSWPFSRSFAAVLLVYEVDR